MPHETPEYQRLKQRDWRRWGAYLGERQWGTVREDYSPDGSAWSYFPHDHARSRAYRWGEDGLAGVCDQQQRLCLALALWNGHDPILKERLFGLTGPEGNHGEDVKELYFHLDATPTHSYLAMLYKYPQAAFPYDQLVRENARRGKDAEEFEITDTGALAAGRYFDVLVEYAKASPDDLLMQVTISNHGPDDAELHVLPQLWFRNTWSWPAAGEPAAQRPRIERSGPRTIARHDDLGAFQFDVDGAPTWLFTDNDTNVERLYGVRDRQGWWKDAFHRCIIHGDKDAVNPQQQGTKAGAWRVLSVASGGSATVRARLAPLTDRRPWDDFRDVMQQRRDEAEAFYATVLEGIDGEEPRRISRRALAGIIWSHQYYCFDVPRWLEGDPGQPPPPAARKEGRNHEWAHLNNAEIVSMPDKWEYPWYAAWDLAFHCLPLAMVDAELAKDQLVLLTREWYMHPNGQLPAYEWAFGDVNPPVHAWAAWRVYEIDRDQRGGMGDRAFLERIFHKLLLNFTWWVNRKDAEGHNVFQGGFLGLDNIGLFDRSRPLPTGGRINQADGTSWMAMYCLNMMRMALELARHNPVYQDTATKFFEHFLLIASAMNNIGAGPRAAGISLWDEQDEFYYDVLALPDGRHLPLKVRSMVGLIPLFAVEVLDTAFLERVPEFRDRLEWFLNYRPDLASLVSRWYEPPHCRTCKPRETRLLSLLRGHRMKCLLRRALDATEFLSDYGVRSLSRIHLQEPYHLQLGDHRFSVAYEPGESQTDLFGGNSNWRGPVWFPVNYLLIESLRRFHTYYGDDFKVEHPTGSGRYLTLEQIAGELGQRLLKLFLPDDQGRRPIYGDCAMMQDDPHCRDLLLFHEHFHGDTGRGVGASHQTGWTSLIAALLSPKVQMSAGAEIDMGYR